MIHSQQGAAEGYRRFLSSSPEWAWKFQILEAESLLWQGKYPEVLHLLNEQVLSTAPKEGAVPILTLQGIAHARQLEIQTATQKFEEAERLCAEHITAGCGQAFQGHGLFSLGQNRFEEARQYLERSLSLARINGDQFLEATSLLNLGGVLVKEGRFDEAVDRSEAAYKISIPLEARDIALAAQQNLGWSYYRLGDAARALDLLSEAEKRADQLGDVYDQENGLTDLGYIYLDDREFDKARQAFIKALSLARTENSKEHILNVLRVLARLSLETNDLEKANQYAEQALQIARESGNHADELYPMLVQGQILALRGEETQAEKIFRQVEGDSGCPVFLKWEAEHRLARLYEEQKHLDAADREYRTALATFEAARSAVRHEDSQLSFLTNAARIYDDYVQFLVARGKTDEALRWADYSRAQTLAEGLGLLPRGSAKAAKGVSPALNAKQIARRVKGTILFYWLGEKQSYLWATTPDKTQLFPLPPRTEVEAAVQRYRRALTGPQDVLASVNQDGVTLYRMLIAPVHEDCSAGASPATCTHQGRQSTGATRIFVIPDGGLNNLNFETLIVPDPTPHYWIEDATIADASSLRLLAAAYAPHKNAGRQLLLVGNSIAPSKEYPELPKAEAQMDRVAQHFTANERRVFARERATPAAYLSSHPEQFSYIHFVAHGTASRLSPLDSAIVLSREQATSDSFKLYARDIIQHPLHADLVTISACYGAGERSYSGEGLVGLSWAFLRAGAHNVIAALWEATDVSTEQLMGKFYDELGKGAPPDAALRSAKLALLHGNFRNPFYWAPFQLYSGS